MHLKITDIFYGQHNNSAKEQNQTSGLDFFKINKLV